MLNDDGWVPGKIVNDVLYGRREHLFLAQGAHQVLDRVTGAVPVTKDAYRIFSENIRKRRELCTNLNCNYLHVIFPDKQTILRDEFPFEDAISMSRSFEAEIGTVNDSILYAHNTLSNYSEIFKRADTHLTDKGTIVATCHLIEQLLGQNIQELLADLLKDIKQAKKWSGDLGSKLNPEIAFDEYFYSGAQKRVWFHNSISGANNGIVDIYVATDPKFMKRVVFFGDSFGRDVCRFLGLLFKEVVFLRTPFLHDEIVHMINPDIVITENVERYLHKSRSDDTRECFFMYPHLRDFAYQPGSKFAEAFSAVLSFPRAPYRDFIGTISSK
jgi:hypothetical protein